MSEDLQSQRYYVLERIGELREQIPQAMQAMVVFRARIEKYRQTDMSAARDTYDALRRVRDDLTQALADVQPLLMELESYALATMAGQLLRGFKGFDLMSTGYRPVYDAVCRFAQQLPEKNTVNAATIGRLMNNVKLGYAAKRIGALWRKTTRPLSARSFSLRCSTCCHWIPELPLPRRWYSPWPECCTAPIAAEPCAGAV